jgi:acyl-CoA synthetase (NDP forming)
VYESIEQATGALHRLVVHGERVPTGVPAIGPAVAAVAAAAAAATAAAATGDGYEDARELLAAGGVPFVAQRTVTDAAQALAAARALGYPVVLKALGLLHKSDAGGVVIAIADDAQLAAAHEDLRQRLAPERCSVERMAPLADGLELLIGARWDARFGPVALAGSGGVYAEVLRDTAVALAPVTPGQAGTMLRSLRAAPLLLGARGRPPLDIGAAARALSALSEIAAAHPELAELEVNPLLVTPAGALALDARIVPAPIPTQESHRAVHLHA